MKPQHPTARRPATFLLRIVHLLCLLAMSAGVATAQENAPANIVGFQLGMSYDSLKATAGARGWMLTTTPPVTDSIREATFLLSPGTIRDGRLPGSFAVMTSPEFPQQIVLRFESITGHIAEGKVSDLKGLSPALLLSDTAGIRLHVGTLYDACQKLFGEPVRRSSRFDELQPRFLARQPLNRPYALASWITDDGRMLDLYVERVMDDGVTVGLMAQ